MNRLGRLRTYARLGPMNIARVAVYRLGLKSARHSVQRLTAPAIDPPFFRAPDHYNVLPLPNTNWDNSLSWFGWYRQPRQDVPPDWFSNPFSNSPQPNADLDWWCIPDFDAGDIKGIWELSRFDWMLAWATEAAHGEEAALKRINLWLADWVQSNPPFKGPNWKCGQEASFRVMHLVTAAWILGQDREPEPGLMAMLLAHLQRIGPTMSYAIGQQNNHGTSEAAALFIGGSFLSGHHPHAEKWERKGRRWLEERAVALIGPDGSFSQYSVTYHRLMLDTFSMAEAWRRHRGIPAFSSRLTRRLSAATDWLLTLTDAETGDAPNIGANDGARLMQLTGSDYRDFRPSVQLAASLFSGTDAFGPGPWTAPLRWLGVVEEGSKAVPQSKSFDDGGYHVLRRGKAMAVLRYPRFRFRPSQADALHLDLWHRGINLLRDAGTFSYNSEGAEWFSSTAAHNTVEFDGRDQMPRLGRFLFGGWLRAAAVAPVCIEDESVTAAAAYRDARSVHHHRAITLTDDGLVCRDTISGTFQAACLRWRLAPGAWYLENDMLRSEYGTISIDIDGVLVKPFVGKSEESRYYLKKSTIPVAWVEIDRPATLVTKVAFS
jgi:hypothetical protein